ncbi:hypothetical protein ABIA24_002431 [Sinorhizobium fredii]
MNAYRAKPLSFPWPPLIYGVAALAALALDRVFPIPVAPRPWLGPVAGGLRADPSGGFA